MDEALRFSQSHGVPCRLSGSGSAAIESVSGETSAARSMGKAVNTW